MGSIQGLRSEGLALRAKEDTNLQISGYLGGVNKVLGGQIVQMIDQLQGIINERTKAYNGLVGKINQEVNGKGGLGDQGIKYCFSMVNNTIALIGAIKAGNAYQIAFAAIGFYQLYLDAKKAKLTGEAAIYDYEKMVSQLGFSDVDQNETLIGIGKSYEDAGAVTLVRARDGLMPRYKPLDPAAGVMGRRGYIGTLRRI